ncbi:hypothetical protein SOVF_055190 [Spinacia oleracea]|nr:hypothetical protein SOVF_055190 [Spinacia oleracea]
MTISDILSPTYVPVVVQSFFDHHRAVNHDGHSMSLVTVKVTELIDGVFIGCSVNHAVVDGTSFWHFWNMWSEIHSSNYEEVPLSRMPIHKRWFPEGYGPQILLPFAQVDEFVSRYEAPQIRERFFHFSAESMARLKDKANEDNNNNTNKVSSFQALSALCWRAIVRANHLPKHQLTSCKLATNNRHRLNPPLSQHYFGNCIGVINTTTTAGELLEHNLGWAASLLHHTVVNHNDKSVRDFFNKWMKSPVVYQPNKQLDCYSVRMTSSPRFDMYGNEFGLGKAVAVRSGNANKLVGSVISYEGCEGGGSLDLEICLSSGLMEALELDEEFMGVVELKK